MPGANHCQYPQCGQSKINCVINSSNSRVWFDLMKEYFPENKFSVKRLFLCNCHFDKDDFILELKPDAIPLNRKQHLDSEKFYENSLVAQALDCFSSDQISESQSERVDTSND